MSAAADLTPSKYEEAVAVIYSRLVSAFQDLGDSETGCGKHNLIAGQSSFRHQIDVSLRSFKARTLVLVECKCWRRAPTPAAILTHAARVLDIQPCYPGWSIIGATVSVRQPSRRACTLATKFGIETHRLASIDSYFIGLRSRAVIGATDILGLRLLERADVERRDGA